MGLLLDRVMQSYGSRIAVHLEQVHIYGIPLLEEQAEFDGSWRLRCGICGFVFLGLSESMLLDDRGGEHARHMVFEALRAERQFHLDPKHTLETVMLRKRLFTDGELLGSIRNPPSEDFLQRFLRDNTDEFDAIMGKGEIVEPKKAKVQEEKIRVLRLKKRR